MQIFILDDQNKRLEWFKEHFNDCKITTARSETEFLVNFKPPYDYVFLDYDLDTTRSRNTFLTLIDNRHLWEYLNRKMTIVHSANFVGGMILQEILPNCLVIPFDILIKILPKQKESCKFHPQKIQIHTEICSNTHDINLLLNSGV